MKATSLEPIFLAVTTDIAPLKTMFRRSRAMSQVRHAIGETEFNTAYDFFRRTAAEMAERGESDRAVRMIEEFDALIMRAGDESGYLLNIHAALMQILTALCIERDDMERATATAAATLSLLSQEPRRKDEPFLEILATLLYDIAIIHTAGNEFKQAERELEKSLKIFDRLAKADPARYGSAQIMALNASTSVYRSRVKQAELLAHYQASTSVYLQMVNQGIGNATTRLVESLLTEGRTLADMGRHREAVQFFTRALKYSTKIEPELTLAQLQMTVDLGESMLQVPAMRDKGVHLLNTMLHKATKINAAEEHRRIVDILVNAKSRSRDILWLWHKIFPR